ncbi:pilus assembly protein [Pseudorhodoferax soli]|uniref:Type IV pilus assembly protein PilX n=1 Tax=Pseudorhodoferax soli TaxID=545864 RepID=A0A368Y0Z0_9BURK|nr:pilus assembly protein [Pseudorhodoferax soli]RCW73872.1 type IV pilus assembly protein PilX [Pseudorhodoferax soli]
MQERGIALLSVMVTLVLAGLAVLASARAGLLYEMVAGHRSDRLRTHAMAEALLLDAEADILGRHGDAPCQPSAAGSQRTASGFIGCRERGTASVAAAPYFPQDTEEFDEVRSLLQVGAAVPCRDGICAPASLHALASTAALPEALGARLGQFTRPSDGAGSATSMRGRYWVEIFLFHGEGTAPTSLQQVLPDPARPFVYRITALAEGHKPGTQVVLRSLFVPYPRSQLQ